MARSDAPTSVQSNRRTDVAVIGAGPAGLAAVQTLTRHGLSVTVLDEQRTAGGQIFRQPPPEMAVRNWLPGRLYDAGKALLGASRQWPNVDWSFETTVLGIFRNDDALSVADHPWALWLQGRNGSYVLPARKVLLAPGCYDRPVAFRGWTLPGVMAAGGLQAMCKSQQVIPGRAILLTGTHPLQLIVADQIVKAGGTVRAVYFAQKWSDMMFVPKSPGAAWAARRKYAKALQSLISLRRAGVPVRFGQSVWAADGDERVSGAWMVPLAGDGRPDTKKRKLVPCDVIATCFGFLVSSDLARQVGASVVWAEDRGGWIVSHDDWMRSDMPGLSVAGEITGVEGSDVAMEEGRLAALGMLQDFGRLGMKQARARAAGIRRQLKRQKAFSHVLCRMAKLPKGLLEAQMTADMTICRCESITAGALQAGLAKNSFIRTASAAKLLFRAGMGPCQGRYCAHNVTKILAGELRIPSRHAGGFKVQVPIKPVSIESIIRAYGSDGYQ